MPRISFEIPGPPGSKERPRQSRGGHFYTPTKTKQYEEYLKECYKKQTGGYYFDTAFLKVEIVVYFDIPKSYTGTRLKAINSGKYFPTQKDCDNIAKAVCDGLNKTAYKDDRQIIDLHVKKLYAVGVNCQSRIEIHITDL